MWLSGHYRGRARKGADATSPIQYYPPPWINHYSNILWLVNSLPAIFPGSILWILHIQTLRYIARTGLEDSKHAVPRFVVMLVYSGGIVAPVSRGYKKVRQLYHTKGHKFWIQWISAMVYRREWNYCRSNTTILLYIIVYYYITLLYIILAYRAGLWSSL